jgi:hypothetical protein
MENLRKVKKLRIKLLGIILLFFFQALSNAQSIWIYDLRITPEYPDKLENITISVFGDAGSPALVTSALFNPTEFILDLFIDTGGIYPVMKFWTHNETIGILSPGDYSVTVRAYDFDDNTLQDECTIDFTVAPEPATLFLFSGGFLAIRTFSKKKVTS